ncbi:MAG: copper-binding protein [Rhodothermales bacterium]
MHAYPTAIPVVVLLLTGLLLVSCSSESADPPPIPGEQEAEMTTTPPETEEPSERHYEVTGVLRSITPSGSHIVVEHDEIPGFMHAMTMPFAVSDTASVGGIDVDDRIRFTLVVSSSGVVAHSVRETSSGEDR